MKSTTIAALAALLSVGAQAVPAGHGHRHGLRHAELHHNKRDIVWKTEYEVETVTVLKTVYGDGSAPTDTPDTLSAYAPPATTTTTSTSTSSAAPLPTVPSSSYVAPAPAPSSAAPTSQAPAPAPVPVQPSSAAPAPVQPSSSAPAPVQYTSSVVAPAPQPEPTSTTPVYQAPAPETTTAPAPATTSAAAPGGGSYSGDGSTVAGTGYSGDFTYYDPGLGACGVSNGATDAIVAISHLMFDPLTPNGNPNKNPLCGRKVTINGKDGSPYTATVVDRCVGCALSDLDMTNTLFNTVTSDGDGRVHNMKWTWA